MVMVATLALRAFSQTNVPEFKAYSLGFADGPSTVETVTNIVGGDVKAYYDPASRQLLVLASGAQHVMVAKLVKQLNVPPRNVRVTVQFRNTGSSSSQGASVTGSGRVIRTSQGTHTMIRAQPQLESRSTQMDSSTRQQLVVASGRQAALFIGEDVPYIDWLMEYGWRYRVFEQQISWQRVGAQLLIEPLIIGDGPSIRVRLTPELSGLVDGNPYRTKFQTVTTEVMAMDGVPFSLGGLAEKNDFYSHFLIGASRDGERKTLDIEMTATILPVTP